METDGHQTPPDTGRPTFPAWPIAIALVAITALLLGTFLFTHAISTVQGLADLPAKAADSLSHIFGSEVTVENNSFTLGDQSILELALVERKIVTTTKYETSFIGVKATAIIKGVYTVKAGYDLNKNYQLTFDGGGKVVRAQLPEPELLSVQTEHQEVFFLDESLIKSIDSAEWEDAYQQNRKAAEQEAQDLGLLEEARKRLLQRTTDLLAPHGLAFQPDLPTTDPEPLPKP